LSWIWPWNLSFHLGSSSHELFFELYFFGMPLGSSNHELFFELYFFGMPLGSSNYELFFELYFFGLPPIDVPFTSFI